MEFSQIRDEYLTQFRPLLKEASQAWWEAATTGSDEAYKKREAAAKALTALHEDSEVFAQLRELKEGGAIADPVLRRELLVMYNNFLEKQADPELNARIIALETAVDKIFSTHRSVIDGERKTENEIRKILGETTDTELARKAWTAYMEVGRKVEVQLKELVGLRNQVAQKLGYANYFSMQMELQEFDEDELIKLFDELDELTSAPFAELKREIDQRMTDHFGITTAELRPWHTGDLFFQEAPDLGSVDLDEIFATRDPVELSIAHYESMGLEVRGILARSDLYEKEGKSPHAFCTSIDRDEDVRILCNVKPNAQWMDTIHHELGHGVYDLYIGKEVPFILHEPSHILTTEGVAMLMGSLTKNVEFLQRVVGLTGDDATRYAEATRRSLRAEKLIFSRWAQVMLRFERETYADPDQDLNQLWWNLKKKYQFLTPPDDMSGADYGAKIHIVAAPVYYHNYMLGDLFASQVHRYAATTVLGIDDPHSTCFYGSKEVGQYLREKIFAPGNLHAWQELTKLATGETLTAKHYAAMYVE